MAHDFGNSNGARTTLNHEHTSSVPVMSVCQANQRVGINGACTMLHARSRRFIKAGHRQVVSELTQVSVDDSGGI
eukprot:14057876-Alexandrium_andersonii.AAC.1